MHIVRCRGRRPASPQPAQCPSSVRRFAPPLPGARSFASIVLPLLLAAAAFAAAPAARAEGCADCPSPTLADLQQHPDFSIERRGPDGIPDYVETDAGACSAQLEGAPEVTLQDSWLVMRGAGEVWNCPHSRSSDTITVTASNADSSSWTWTTQAGGGFSALGVSFQAAVENGQTTGQTITEVTSISKTIHPGWCHRITWEGWFEVALYEATGSYRVTRHYAWWTKNVLTGSTVHAHGDIHVDCGAHTLAMERKAPIRGYFRLGQRGCNDPACAGVVEKHLGYFPPPPEPDDGDDDDVPVKPDGDADPTEDDDADDDADEEGESDVDESGDLPPPPAGDDDDVAPTGPLSDPLAPSR